MIIFFGIVFYLFLGMTVYVIFEADPKESEKNYAVMVVCLWPLFIAIAFVYFIVEYFPELLVKIAKKIRKK